MVAAGLRSCRLSPRQAFGPVGCDPHLASRSVRGGAFTLIGQGGSFMITTLRTVILARLLTPADFGLIGMVVVVVAFAELFKDMGLTTATVQKPSIRHEQISSLFWMNVLICSLIVLLLWTIAPAVARFYSEPDVARVMRALALSFIISGLSIQHYALLKRSLRFRELAGIQVIAQAVAFVVAVLGAISGWGYWALVAGSLSYSLANTVLLVVACPWIPGRAYGTGEVWDMIKFGGHLAGFNVVNYFARHADNLLIGRYAGAHALGFYDRAYHILLLPITMLSGPLSAVAIPVLSRLRGDRNRMHRYYLHVLYMLALFASPVVCFLYLASDEVVLIMLGSDWAPVAAVFRILALGALFQPVYNTQSWLHVAIGRADRVFRWGLIGTPLFLCAFVIGLQWGMHGVAMAYSLATIAATVGALWYAGQGAGLPFARIVLAVIRPIGAALVSTAAIGVLANLGSSLPVFISMLGKGAGFMLLYGICLVIVYRGFGPFRDVAGLYPLLRGGPMVMSTQSEQPSGS